MADNTKIEWARHPVTGRGASWNPLLARTKATGKVGYHCEHASPGCVNCYAESFNERRLPARGTGLPFKPGHRSDVDIFLDDAQMLLPLKWRDPRGVFVCSMTDLFGEFVSDAQIDQMMAVMALAPQHVFMVLTKRADRMRRYLSDPATPRRVYEIVCDLAVWHELPVALIAPGINPAHAPAGTPIHLGQWPLRNLWPGVSVEDQRRADERLPDLVATPAAVRFVSAEPLLELINIEQHLKPAGSPGHCFDIDGEWWHPPGSCPNCSPAIDWVIAGMESGTRSRAIGNALEILRSLRDQCARTGAAYFFKQWGSWAFAPDGLNGNEALRWATIKGYSLSRRSEAWGGSGGVPTRYQHFQENGRTAFYVGKKDAGRLLDGVEHNAMPAVS